MMFANSVSDDAATSATKAIAINVKLLRWLLEVADDSGTEYAVNWAWARWSNEFSSHDDRDPELYACNNCSLKALILSSDHPDPLGSRFRIRFQEYVSLVRKTRLTSCLDTAMPNSLGR